VSPVYWKPKYATRGMRHRAWVKKQAAREQALRGNRGDTLLARLLRRLRRGNSGSS
jgi:hypothetical protein